jgi:hypothetical protein
MDEQLLRAIHIDVMRLTRHFVHFGDTLDAYLRRMERILYLFAHCSSPCGYQQGFHELLFPLFFVGICGAADLGLDGDAVEAIAYFMLHSLINGTAVGDFFIIESDELRTVCQDAFKVLQACDPRLASAMTKNGVDPVLCAYSWVNVLFAQIYELNELFRLWDFIFAVVARIRETVCHLTAAHLMALRHKFTGKEFARMMNAFHDLEIMSESEPIRLCSEIIRKRRRRV